MMLSAVYDSGKLEYFVPEVITYVWLSDQTVLRRQARLWLEGWTSLMVMVKWVTSLVGQSARVRGTLSVAGLNDDVNRCL